MLERLQHYATKVQWLRVPLICLSVLSFLLAAYVAIVPDNPDEVINDSLFIPALLLFCWGVLCYCLISVFKVAVPTLDAKMGFFSRLVARFRRALRSIIVLGFLALSIALVVVSFKLVTTGLG